MYSKVYSRIRIITKIINFKMNFTKYKLLNILIWLHEYLHILAISFVTDLRIKDLTIKIISNEKFAVSYKNNGDEVDMIFMVYLINYLHYFFLKY